MATTSLNELFQNVPPKERRAFASLGSEIESDLKKGKEATAIYRNLVQNTGCDGDSAQFFVNTIIKIQKDNETIADLEQWSGLYARQALSCIGRKLMKSATLWLHGGGIAIVLLLTLYSIKVIPSGQGTAALFLIYCVPLLWGLSGLFKGFFNWIEFRGTDWLVLPESASVTKPGND